MKVLLLSPICNLATVLEIPDARASWQESKTAIKTRASPVKTNACL